MRRVAVVGVGQLPFRSRYPADRFDELAMMAAKRALADAGLVAGDVTSAVYSVYSELLIRQGTPDVMIHDYLGLNGRPGQRVTAGAASGGYAVKTAWADVASGFSDVVLCLGVQKALDVDDPETGQRADAALEAESMTLDTTWHLPFSQQPWALLLTAHMDKFGGPTEEQIARVAVKNRANAVRNPNAHLRRPVTVEEVLDSRLTNWPTTMFESCLYGEAASAVVLVAEELVRPEQRPVWITGVGTCHHNSTDEMSADDAGRVWPLYGASRQAYRMAGVTDPRTELDVVELNDLVAGLELMSYAELGLCAPGEGGALIDEGFTAFDGPLPVNPSGGRIGAGHIAGVSGIYSTGEIVQQLRGEAGERQVPIRAGRGLACMVGGAGLGLGAAIVLERDGR
ncbi:thiolase family protein [Jiangella anatolica]|nr:thiolase family protein [Jiangella anatolica]